MRERERERERERKKERGRERRERRANGPWDASWPIFRTGGLGLFWHMHTQIGRHISCFQ